MNIKAFFSFRQNKFFWLNILGMILAVVLLIVGVLRWLDVYTRHGQAVVVPDVKGMTVSEAREAFARNGLTCVVSDSSYRKHLTPGCILDYNPPAGQKVKEGRIIYLTINTLSVPLRNVPDVADNSSLREAEARLLAAGFRLDSIDSIPGERDWVYEIRYKDTPLLIGERVPEGSLLKLVIGNGQPLPPDSLAADSLGLLPDSLNLHRDEPAHEELPEEESWF